MTPSEMASEASDGELACVLHVCVLACSDQEDNDLDLQVDAASDRARGLSLLTTAQSKG
jgi:hypothetical protein